MPASKPTEPQSSITLLTLNRQSLRIVIKGVTPLLTNRFSESKSEGIENKQLRKAKEAKPPRNPEVEFRDAIHVIDVDKGIYGFPSIGLKKALVRAGKYAGETMCDLRGSLQVLGDLIPIHSAPPVMRRDRVVFSNVTSLAYRPMFESWSMAVDIVFNANSISRDQIVNLARIAGFSVGVGSWRPESDGTFGQFDVLSVEETTLAL